MKMLSLSALYKGTKYSRIEGGEHGEEQKCSKQRSSRKTFMVLVFSIIFASLTGGLGYWAGIHSIPPALPDWLGPAGKINHTFHYRKEFSGRPSNETDAMWKIIFPRGRGFIMNTDVAPEPMGVAVFHQLHCLNALRHGYYAALDGIKPDEHAHASPGHIRHCIDYLRSSLMCAADTNLEPIDSKLKGVTGFGNPRMCRDIVGVIKWTDQWRTHNQTDIM